jgi:hypothetical protein
VGSAGSWLRGEVGGDDDRRPGGWVTGLHIYRVSTYFESGADQLLLTWGVNFRGETRQSQVPGVWAEPGSR